MYIAEVLQDPNSEEAGSGSGEDDGQGSSQDEEIINVENGLNEDFQSGEDSLIDNEVRHWYCLEQEKKNPPSFTWGVHWICELNQELNQQFSKASQPPWRDFTLTKAHCLLRIKWIVTQGPFTGSHQTMSSVCVPAEGSYSDNARVAASTCPDIAEAHPKTLHMDP